MNPACFSLWFLRHWVWHGQGRCVRLVGWDHPPPGDKAYWFSPHRDEGLRERERSERLDAVCGEGRRERGKLLFTYNIACVKLRCNFSLTSYRQMNTPFRQKCEGTKLQYWGLGWLVREGWLLERDERKTTRTCCCSSLLQFRPFLLTTDNDVSVF